MVFQYRRNKEQSKREHNVVHPKRVIATAGMQGPDVDMTTETPQLHPQLQHQSNNIIQTQLSHASRNVSQGISTKPEYLQHRYKTTKSNNQEKSPKKQKQPGNSIHHQTIMTKPRNSSQVPHIPKAKTVPPKRIACVTQYLHGPYLETHGDVEHDQHVTAPREVSPVFMTEKETDTKQAESHDRGWLLVEKPSNKWRDPIVARVREETPDVSVDKKKSKPSLSSKNVDKYPVEVKALQMIQDLELRRRKATDVPLVEEHPPPLKKIAHMREPHSREHPGDTLFIRPCS